MYKKGTKKTTKGQKGKKKEEFQAYDQMLTPRQENMEKVDEEEVEEHL